MRPAGLDGADHRRRLRRLHAGQGRDPAREVAVEPGGVGGRDATVIGGAFPAGLDAVFVVAGVAALATAVLVVVLVRPAARSAPAPDHRETART